MYTFKEINNQILFTCDCRRTDSAWSGNWTACQNHSLGSFPIRVLLHTQNSLCTSQNPQKQLVSNYLEMSGVAAKIKMYTQLFDKLYTALSALNNYIKVFNELLSLCRTLYCFVCTKKWSGSFLYSENETTFRQSVEAEMRSSA